MSNVVKVVLIPLYLVGAIFGALVADHTDNFWIFLAGSAPLAILCANTFLQEAKREIEKARRKPREACGERRYVSE